MLSPLASFWKQQAKTLTDQLASHLQAYINTNHGKLLAMANLGQRSISVDFTTEVYCAYSQLDNIKTEILADIANILGFKSVYVLHFWQGYVTEVTLCW